MRHNLALAAVAATAALLLFGVGVPVFANGGHQQDFTVVRTGPHASGVGGFAFCPPGMVVSGGGTETAGLTGTSHPVKIDGSAPNTGESGTGWRGSSRGGEVAFVIAICVDEEDD